MIKWYGSWKQYCYFPDGQTLYSRSCLKDICDFILQLNVERKLKQDEQETKIKSA